MSKGTTLTAELTGAGAFWVINKNLARYVTLIDLAILMEHVYIYDKECTNKGLIPTEDNTQMGYMAYKQSMSDTLGLSRDTIRRSEIKLISLGLLKTKSRATAVGKFNYYSLQASTIQAFFKDPYSYIMADEAKVDAIGGSSKMASIADKINRNIHSHVAKSAVPTTEFAAYYNNTNNNGVAGATHPADLQSAIVPPAHSESLESNKSIEQPLPSTRREELATAKPKVDPPSAKKLERTLLPETIELIKYWDSFDSLSKHTLQYSSRTTIRYALQYVYVQKLDDILVKLLKGKYYANNPEVDHEALKNTAFTIPQIKLAIERFAKLATPEYNKTPQAFQNYKLSDFFYKGSAFMRLTLVTKGGTIQNKNKYKARYAFIHCTLFNPVPLAQTGTGHKTTTEYPTTVNNLITILKDHGGYKDTVMNYNTVVQQTEKAIKNIKAVANGKSNGIITMLPRYIMNCMSSANRGLHVDNLFFTVEYKLMAYLREIREIA